MLQRETKLVPGEGSEALGFHCNVRTIIWSSTGKKNNTVEWIKPQGHQRSRPTPESGSGRLGVGSPISCLHKSIMDLLTILKRG